MLKNDDGIAASLQKIHIICRLAAFSLLPSYRILMQRHTANEAARFMLNNNLRCTDTHQLAKAQCVHMHIIGKAVAAEIFYAFPQLFAAVFFKQPFLLCG